MKRIGAIVCAIMIMVAMSAPAVFAATEKVDKAQLDDIQIVSTSPENGSDGVAVDNFSIKIRFNKDMIPKNKNIRKTNAKQFVLKSEDGEKVPVKVFYSPDEEGLMLVAADPEVKSNRSPVKGDTEYTLTIKRDLMAADGSTLGAKQEVTVKTLNQQRSTIVYMILMVAMMGGMIFFTMKSAQKSQEKEKEEKKTSKQGVNPYKEAKKSGKSVSEIVAKDSKRKAKAAEREAREREAYEALEAEIREQVRRESNKRVSGPRPISAAGSTYKVTVKKTAKAEPAKSSTNSKNKSGKKKNKKK